MSKSSAESPAEYDYSRVKRPGVSERGELEKL